MSVSLDGLVNQNIRDDGQHFVCYQIRGNYKTIQPLKACLKEDICCKAQTIGYLFFFFPGRSGLDIVFYWFSLSPLSNNLSINYSVLIANALTIVMLYSGPQKGKKQGDWWGYCWKVKMNVNDTESIYFFSVNSWSLKIILRSVFHQIWPYGQITSAFLLLDVSLKSQDVISLST